MKGFEKEISTDFILRVAQNEEEGKRIADFNETVHGEGLNDYVLLVHHLDPHLAIDQALDCFK